MLSYLWYKTRHILHDEGGKALKLVSHRGCGILEVLRLDIALDNLI